MAPIVPDFPRPLYFSPFYTHDERYGDTPPGDNLYNTITLVERQVAGGFDWSVLPREITRTLPLGYDYLLDSQRVVDASYLPRTRAWWAAGAHMADLQIAAERAYALPDKPVILYLDNPDEWPATPPAWIRPEKTWPSAQAYRRAGETLAAFQTRIEGYLLKLINYAPFISLTPRFDRFNDSLTLAEAEACMPFFELWIRVFPIVAVQPFADRRPTGMEDNPALKVWGQDFFAAVPGIPAADQYWTPAASVPGPPPPTSVVDGWYPQWSPSGLYLACGTIHVTVGRVSSVSGAAISLGNVTEVNEGIAPQWYNPGGIDTLLFSNRHEAFLTVNTPPPFVAAASFNLAVNAYGAGGGKWVGWIAPSTLKFDSGADQVGRLPVPAGPVVDQAGRMVYLSADESQVIQRSAAGALSVLDTHGPGIARPHCATQGAVWQRLEGGQLRTYGSRGAGVELLHVVAGSEFNAVVVDTPVGPWILAHDQSRLYLRPWGQAVHTVVAVLDNLQHPHAVHTLAHGGGFLVAWISGTGELFIKFAQVDVTGGTTPPPPPDPDPPFPPPPPPPTPPPTTPPTPPPPGTLVSTPAVRLQPKRKAVYPHVTQITDPAAQQSTKLLWDRMFEVIERLEVGDIAQRFATVEQSVQSTNTRIDQQQTDLLQDPSEGVATSIPGGGPGDPPDDPPSPPSSGSCSDSPGNGHFDPGGPLTEDRARKIVCGTGDEFSSLRAPTVDLPTRENNAELLTQRAIWHLDLGGFNAGRQRNPSTAISKDKLALVIGTETRAFDIYQAFDAFTSSMVMQWVEVFPADLVADAGIPD